MIILFLSQVKPKIAKGQGKFCIASVHNEIRLCENNKNVIADILKKKQLIFFFKMGFLSTGMRFFSIATYDKIF